MATTIAAVYERGVFLPKKHLKLEEGQEDRLTITTSADGTLDDPEFTALGSE